MSVHPLTDPAAWAPPSGVGAPLAHHRLSGARAAVGDAGDTDAWHMRVIPEGAEVGGVGGGAAAAAGGFVTGQREEAVEVGGLPEGVVLLGRGREASCSELDASPGEQGQGYTTCTTHNWTTQHRTFNSGDTTAGSQTGSPRSSCFTTDTGFKSVTFR